VTTDSADPAEHDNGILAQVPGQYVAAALQLLPPPAAGADQASVEIDGPPELGRVRIHAEVVRWRRGKASTVFWSAVRADRADG
jgi:hypothetical protein